MKIINVSNDVIQQLLNVDNEAWLKEVDDIQKYLEEFGNKVPEQLYQELKNIKSKL